MMTRLCSVVWIVYFTLMLATTGCAAQRKVTAGAAGISRLGYSIQVGAFKEVGNAERLAAKLQVKGIDAFYFKKEDGVYAVRFGDFPSREEAKRAGKKLVAEKLVGAFFIAEPRPASIRKTKEPELRQLPPATVHAPTIPKPRAASGDMGEIAARTAERFVGIPYRWGGDTVVDGMDCSGFVRAVYNLCGVNIPRTSRDQYKVGDQVGRDDLKDGDLVFFGESEEKINHVGIYVGNGRFVHAPRRGDDIKVSALDENYFTSRFVGAKRYF
ncbi:peptidoglycan-binding protein [Geobacter sp. AOG1]|nr:peptidoglycan-binding protein [Geobacter sp. AOG1]